MTNATGYGKGHMKLTNILTIDLEDWFQVSNLDGCISREEWPECEFRLRRNADRLLELLEAVGARATFFVLGWNAEKCPELIRDIRRCRPRDRHPRPRASIGL